MSDEGCGCFGCLGVVLFPVAVFLCAWAAHCGWRMVSP